MANTVKKLGIKVKQRDTLPAGTIIYQQGNNRQLKLLAPAIVEIVPEDDRPYGEKYNKSGIGEG